MCCFSRMLCGRIEITPQNYEIESSGFLQHLQGWFYYIIHYFFLWTALSVSVCPSHFDFSFEFQSVMPCDGRTDRNTITQLFDKQLTTH